jgi:hypothetical protein
MTREILAGSAHAHNRAVPCRARFALVTHEQVLDYILDLSKPLAGQFSVLFEGEVLRPANPLGLEERGSRIVPESLELFAHRSPTPKRGIL